MSELTDVPVPGRQNDDISWKGTQHVQKEVGPGGCRRREEKGKYRVAFITKFLQFQPDVQQKFFNC